MDFRPFRHQADFLKSKKRYRLLIASKRSGKSEAAYVDTVIKAETQPGYVNNGRDPYLIGIVAPTDNMLRRLVWPKFREFAAPFEREFKTSDSEFMWNTNNTRILGFSAENITRMEGYKMNHIHMTEAFQQEEAVYLEAIARLGDTKGSLVIDGSLGVNFKNPKNHWIYKTFIEKEHSEAEIFTWATIDNPYFPKDELTQLKENLNPKTYRQLFEIDWNIGADHLVFEDFDEGNIGEFSYDERLETSITIDWGWAHPMSCLFVQYDERNDTVYVIDEIVSSKLTLEKLFEKIKAKPYKIKHWFCDIAGNQEREQTGISNVQWFKSQGVNFKFRQTAITYGINIMRTYVKNGLAQSKLKIDETRCPKLIDCLRNYQYKVKDGVVVNENPLKKDDDPIDSLRYYFVNRLDKQIFKKQFEELNRWGL